MARFTHARNTFQFGEASPASYGRADLQTYRQMLEESKNMIIKALGGGGRRPGGALLAGTFADSDWNDFANVDTVKLIPACFSYDKWGFLNLTPDTIKRYSANLSYGGATSHIGAVANLGSLLYNTGNNWHVANAGEGYYEGIEQWAQFGDLIVITNGIQEPLFVAGISAGVEKYFLLGEGKLTSLGTLNNFVTQGWSLYPFDPVNTSTTTMKLSAVTTGTGRTLTASAATFSSGMVGMIVRFNTGAAIGHAKITAFTSSTVVTVTVLSAVDAAFLSPATSTSWALSQWGGSARGWPKTCAFYKERLIFGSNTYLPDGFWASQIGDLYEFSQVDPSIALVNSDAFNGRIGQSESANINHIFPKENLFTNMETKECYLGPVDQLLSIGALNTETRSYSHYGAAQRQPAGLMESLIYIGWPENYLSSVFGRKILEMNFNSQDDHYEVLNLSKYTPDITRDRCIGHATLATTRPTFVRIAVTKKPEPVIWALDTTGKLYSLTRDKEAGVTAWSHHTLGGSYLSSDPKVLDIINVAGNLVLAVLRNTGGNVDQICYEQLSEEFVSAALDSSACFLDYSTTGTVSAGSISGLTHLNGNTVHAVVGGVYLGTYVVSGNAISVGTGYNGQTAVVGYNYESLLTLSALESNALFGSGLGEIKRTEQVTVLFERTVAAKIGVLTRTDIEEDVQFRDSSVAANAPIPLFTGEKVIKLPADYETRQNVYIKQDKPYPMTVNGVICKGILYD